MTLKTALSPIQLSIAALSVCLLSSCGQNAYQGYVYDRQTHLPLKDVAISYDGQHVRSDAKGYFKITHDDVTSDLITFSKTGYRPDTARTILIHSGEQMHEQFKSGKDTVFLSPILETNSRPQQTARSANVLWPISSKRFTRFYEREGETGDHKLVIPRGVELASYEDHLVPVHESPFRYDIKRGDRYLTAEEFTLGDVRLKVIIYIVKGENDGRVLNIQLNSYNPNGQLQDALLLDSRFTFEVEYYRDFVIQKNGSISITSYSKDPYTYNEQGDITGTLENAKTESSTVVYDLKPDGKFQRVN